MAKNAVKAKMVEPFRTRKTKEETSRAAGETLTPPKKVAAAIDMFREAQDQARHYEGEATIHKNEILEYAEDEYAKRLHSGKNKSFKLLGDDSMVTFVVMDSSAGLTEDEAADFAERFGQKAADELIVKDLGSLRFDAGVLQENYDEVVAALQVLPEKILSHLFKPMLLRAKECAAEGAKRYAKNADQLLEIIKALKMKNYIR